MDWLENIDATSIWTASRLVTGPASDGGRARVPDLKIKDPITGGTLKEARDNEQKSKMFFKAFFPPKPVDEEDQSDIEYPEPKWKFQHITNEQISRVISKLKPYKASRPGTIPNSVFVNCSDMMVQFLAPLYRATDTLRYYPDKWKITETPVLRKPGKSDYAIPGAWRPIVLSDGCAKILNAVKTEDIVNNLERHRILPDNHFGG
ncbi:hypothetical protein BD779DRAFT_1445793, partial [Infundibulicybe gibba]